MTDKAISPLRRRMIEDMTVRGFTASTQRGYITSARSRISRSFSAARRMVQARRICGVISCT